MHEPEPRPRTKPDATEQPLPKSIPANGDHKDVLGLLNLDVGIIGADTANLLHRMKMDLSAPTLQLLNALASTSPQTPANPGKSSLIKAGKA